MTETGDLPVQRRAPTAEETRALANPVRLRIIRELFDESLTNNELAARLGRDKATVLHHVRVLVEAGFVEALPIRRGQRGSRERPYRTTGKSWTLSLELGDDPDGPDDAMAAAFWEELHSPHERLTQSRLVLRLNEPDRTELADRLQAILDEYAARTPDPEGRKVAVYLNLYLPGPPPA